MPQCRLALATRHRSSPVQRRRATDQVRRCQLTGSREVTLKKLGLGVETARRIALDATIGLAVFMVFAFGVTLDRTGGVGTFHNVPHLITVRANAIEQSTGRTFSRAIINPSNTPGHPAVDMAFARTDQTTAIVLLALMFSAVFAFNLAFYRHLRAAYAAKRRSRLHRLNR